MDLQKQQTLLQVLRRDLIPALGCTEPIAIAFAAAKAKRVLGRMPKAVEVICSGAVIKNAKSVVVPCSDGMIGINAAAVLGIVGGNPEAELEVLSSVEKPDILHAKQLLEHGFCRFSKKKGADGLFIRVRVEDSEGNASVEIQNHHTNITEMTKNGEILYQNYPQVSGAAKESPLQLADILDFANQVPFEDIQSIVERQITLNSAIASEGIAREYGASIGKKLLEYNDARDVRVRAKAMAAAASDARMNGCALPVVLNSGSGNQGIAASLPVIEYAKSLDCAHEKLCRALVVSNLVALEQKWYIGSLSAYCGAVSAATGAGAGIAYLLEASQEKISDVITTTLCIVGGILCDGAKSSCAAKIATAVDAAIFSTESILKHGRCFHVGEGLAGKNADQTMAAIGRVGNQGMQATQDEIISIMVENQ